MQLKHLVDLKGRLFAPYLDAGDGPFGTRYIYNAAEGTFEGRGSRAGSLPGGGDWPLADADGTMRLDIRLVLETDDGAVIYFQDPMVCGDTSRRTRTGTARYPSWEHRGSRLGTTVISGSTITCMSPKARLRCSKKRGSSPR